MREAVVFYKSFLEAINLLPEEEQLSAYRAIVEYGINGTEPGLDGVAGAVFLLARPQIDANNRRYENGKRGGRPKKLTEEQVKEGKQLRNKGEYNKWRKAVLDKTGGRCSICGSSEGVVAHHIKSVHEDKDGWYDIKNGAALCSKCHAAVHAEGQRLVINDATGNLEITEEKPRNNLKQTERKPKEKEKEKDKDKKKEKYKDKTELEKAIDNYIEHRKQIKAPMTDQALKLMLNKLERLSGGRDGIKIAILNQSIENGWKGIFELKDKRPAAKWNNGIERSEDMAALELKLLASN